MKFREYITEAREKHVVFAFGRMNPPTIGHEKLVNKVKDIAKEVGGTIHIVLSHTHDSNKNPLTPQQKLKHAKRYFPDVNITSADKTHPDFLSQVSKLYSAGASNLHMIAGSDRIKEYEKTLKQYNGVKGKHGYYKFKTIELHSAGERDPDAEGVEGMSASKMRDAASKGNFKKFKQGVPPHVSKEEAKELYNDVRKGLGIKESLEEVELDILFEEVLLEGVHDKGIFKAVFLGGGPGSGKDYVLDNTLAGHGLTELNSDRALEFLMDKHNLDKKMPADEEAQRNEVRKKAKSITELRQMLAIQGRNGLIINGTADDPAKVAKIKDLLEKLGYETSMLMVNTKDEISQQRNIERGQRGGRTVPESIRKEKWDSVQAARPELAKLFGANYMEFDNSEDLRMAPPEVQDAKKKEMLQLFKNVQKFVNKPPKNDVAKQWIGTELNKKDTLPISKKQEVAPHPDSKAAEEAKRLGLTYFGFGRYGRNGKVTHRVVHDRLVDVATIKPPKQQENIPVSTSHSDSKPKEKPIPGYEMKQLGDKVIHVQYNKNKKINEDFEWEDFEEDTQINEESKPKQNYLKDSTGKVRVFMLRRAAAKEAHQRNGEIEKHNNGYVVKLKEEYIHVIQNSSTIQEATNRGSTSTTSFGWSNQTRSSTRGRITLGEARAVSGKSCGHSGTCDCGGSTEEETTEKKKLTLSKIRAAQKEKVKESIDKGIEPGLSMASSGESIARDTGEKIKKYTGKATQVREAIGDGGEAVNSISDKKEDELKKVGINLKSFKAKNYL